MGTRRRHTPEQIIRKLREGEKLIGEGHGTARAAAADLRVVSAVGWRKAHTIAARKGLVINRKRTHRLWLDEGLKRPARVVKKQRCGPARHQRLRAQRPDHMWALDFQVDVTVDGRQVRFPNIIDEYAREALATRAARSFHADATIAVLDDLITRLGRRPQHIRMDNGPELTAHALVDWCRYAGVDPAYIDPGSPWQNGFCESFNGRFRDELLICEQFNTLLDGLSDREAVDRFTFDARRAMRHPPAGLSGSGSRSRLST